MADYDSISYTDFLLGKEEYPQRATFSHWQLKDLLCCAAETGEVFFADCMAVKSFDPPSGASTTHLELKYPPTALTVGCGYLCAVGPDAELTVKCIPTGQLLFGGKCGSTISNSCLIRRHEGGLGEDVRLLVCLNEEKVKVFSLPSMALLTDVHVSTQVNHCAISPDGRLLVAVGDSHFLYTYAIHGHEYHRLTEHRVFDDCCFSGAFSPDGRHFVAAAQNGTVVLMRVHGHALHPTVTLRGFGLPRSPPPAASKYCRAVKLHPTPGIDLVAFTESTSHIHLLDLWRPHCHQVVRVAPDNEETDICGMCFSPDGAFLYVALQDRLVRLAVDVAGRRCAPAGELL